MGALVAGLLGLVVLGAAVLPAAPAQAATPPSLFPLAVGATWVRRSDDGTVATTRVTGTKRVGGRTCAVVERAVAQGGRERVSRSCIAATASEVLVLEFTSPRGRTQVTNPPRPILKLPPRVGLTWTWVPADPVVDLKITETWLGQETVKTPAGTFRAWKLQSVAVGEDGRVTTITWYAPGVGAVRVERTGHRGDRTIRGWSELVRYTIP